MSIASEYAKYIKAAHNPPSLQFGLHHKAVINPEGKLFIEGCWASGEALLLARWLIEMFGDEPYIEARNILLKIASGQEQNISTEDILHNCGGGK